MLALDSVAIDVVRDSGKSEPDKASLESIMEANEAENSSIASVAWTLSGSYFVLEVEAAGVGCSSIEARGVEL